MDLTVLANPMILLNIYEWFAGMKPFIMRMTVKGGLGIYQLLKLIEKISEKQIAV